MVWCAVLCCDDLQGEARRKHSKGTADVHLIGEVTGAIGFGPEPLYCTWQLVYDAQLWSVALGRDKVGWRLDTYLTA